LDFETRAKGTNNRLESFRPQQRRGSSPEIDCVRRECENLLAQSISLKVGRQPDDFLFQGLAISVEETGGFDSRTEIAEAALRGAKGNLNVDAERLHAFWKVHVTRDFQAPTYD
jgi:hypothetical protein